MERFICSVLLLNTENQNKTIFFIPNYGCISIPRMVLLQSMKRSVKSLIFREIQQEIPKMVSRESKFIHPSDMEIDLSGWNKLTIPSYLSVKPQFDEIQSDILEMTASLKESISSKHPVLHSASNYFFNISGKKTRPMIVIMLARAIASARYISEAKRLGEITEMIHVASLIHDDIIDESDTRRGQKSLHAVYGNKIAVLAGDFLLSRSSVSLTKLGNIEVIRLMSTVIEHLAHGEIWQMAGIGTASFPEYMLKSFFKTASLIASSCQSMAVLAGGDEKMVESCFLYGKHVGLAYQLVDDSLDFTSNSELLGKPAAGADLRLGLTTAPVHFAIRQFPELNEMITRKFAEDNDVNRVFELVKLSQGVEHTKSLAKTHIKRAIEALQNIPDSPMKDALIVLASMTLDRTS